MEEGEIESRGRLGSAEEWEHEPVHRASLAMEAPAHRDHIKEHLHELLVAVRSMEEKSEALLEVLYLKTHVNTIKHVDLILSFSFVVMMVNICRGVPSLVCARRRTSQRRSTRRCTCCSTSSTMCAGK